jgi:hypothetical protein
MRPEDSTFPSNTVNDFKLYKSGNKKSREYKSGLKNMKKD